MLISLLTISLIILLIVIFFQDLKDRQVHVWVFVACAILITYKHLNTIGLEQFAISVSFNLLIVLSICCVLFLYSKLKLKLPLYKTFGIGDFLFFVIIGLGFPTITFTILFSFSLLFTLLVFALFKKRLTHHTVPLAGLQALFFALIFLLNWASNFVNLYQY